MLLIFVELSLKKGWQLQWKVYRRVYRSCSAIYRIKCLVLSRIVFHSISVNFGTLKVVFWVNCCHCGKGIVVQTVKIMMETLHFWSLNLLSFSQSIAAFAVHASNLLRGQHIGEPNHAPIINQLVYALKIMIIKYVILEKSQNVRIFILTWKRNKNTKKINIKFKISRNPKIIKWSKEFWQDFYI